MQELEERGRISDDLISRKALLKELREIMNEPHNTMFLMGIGAATSIIEHRETAFDKVKVINEINKIMLDEKIRFVDQAVNRAIKVVKKGGIE